MQKHFVLVQLDILEYIHEHEYVHADIKASNLMLSSNDANQVSVTIVIAILLSRVINTPEP